MPLRIPLLVLALALTGCGEPPPAPPSENPAEPGPILAIASPRTFPTVSPVVSDPPSFIDRTQELGIRFHHVQGTKHWYVPQTTGSGVAMFDADGDGALDLYFVQGSGPDDGRGPAPVPPGALYRQLDGRFVECAALAGLEARGFGIGVLAADLDNDGYTDVLVTQYGGPARLFRSNGDGTYTEAKTRTPLTQPMTFASCALALDLDRDGLLDVYVGQYLDYREKHWKPSPPVSFAKPWRCVITLMPYHYKPLPNFLFKNEGGGRWTDVTARAGVADEGGKTMAALATDFDGDGWPDLFVGNDVDTKNRAYRNRGDGTFADVSDTSFFGEVRGSMGFAVGSAAPGERPDVLVSHFYNPTGLYRTLRGTAKTRLKFEDTGPFRGLGGTASTVGWAVAFVDVDNDGDEDILQINGNVMPGPQDARGPLEPLAGQLFKASNDAYELVAPHAGDPVSRKRVGRSAALGDLDRDGRVDVALSNNNQPAELWTGVGPDAAWIGLLPVGTRSAREGTGAVVTLTAGGSRRTRELVSGDSYLATSWRALHFGLGAHRDPVAAEVRWPGGRTETFANLTARRYHRLVEGQGR